MPDDALYIKLCDRLDNISGLTDTDESFRDKYINETLYILKRKPTNTQLNIIKTIAIVLDILMTIVKKHMIL